MDERELVDGLAAGNPDALSALLTQYAPRLIAFATSLLQSPEGGEDVVAELLARWVDKPPTIGGPLVPFLMSSVRNGVIDSIRRDRRQTGSHPREPGGIAKPDRRKIGPLARKQPDESEEEFYAITAEALATLSKPDRDVLDLAYLRTMTREERAAELNKSLGVYDKRLHDARERLKRAIDAIRNGRKSVA